MRSVALRMGVSNPNYYNKNNHCNHTYTNSIGRMEAEENKKLPAVFSALEKGGCGRPFILQLPW